MNHELILQIHNEIVFEPIKHTYFLNGKYLTSGTTFISQYHKPFKKEEVLDKLYQDPLQKARKRYEWDNSSVWGTYIHELLELHFTGHTIQTNEVEFIAGINRVEELIREYDLEILGCEIRVTNGIIAGTIDLLTYNTQTNKYVLIDFKTCQKLDKRTYNDERFYAPLQDIEYNKFNKYSLQLSLYSAILEDNYENVEVEDMFLIWINKDNKGVIRRCDDYREQIRRVL